LLISGRLLRLERSLAVVRAEYPDQGLLAQETPRPRRSTPCRQSAQNAAVSAGPTTIRKVSRRPSPLTPVITTALLCTGVHAKSDQTHGRTKF